ncbi:N-terminal acetyltransferase A complex catalytic subunit NAA10 [Dissostichus eleginoides]|uniref:N-terminal acetyltransferase A complex catalytic subunit NAA10 n=1 Tax=Dissostichus eleginoides TaxID=100907 RepID=A0AAD9BXC7_DISEL|nr:N-terminal acetyltransferase A complex catalytic subunit NAA10 [Dissostichus eleginoides]
MSLSLVLPALLDLNAHLSEFPEAQGSCYRDLASLSQTMKENMGQRFSCFLDPSDTKFSPLIAAACFLDPTVSPKALIENEHDDVQIQELLIKAEDYIAQMVSPVIREEETDDNEDEEERREGSVYQSLKPLALDLLAMPASQAFAERVFSITGDLTRGRRNRARVILERSAFLKLNRDQ